MAYSSTDVKNSLSFEKYFYSLTIQETLTLLNHYGYLSGTVNANDITWYLAPEGVLTYLYQNYTTQGPSYSYYGPTPRPTPLTKHPFNILQELKTRWDVSGMQGNFLSLLTYNRAASILTDEAVSNVNVVSKYIYCDENLPSPSGSFSYVLSAQMPSPSTQYTGFPFRPNHYQSAFAVMNRNPSGHKLFKAQFVRNWNSAVVSSTGNVNFSPADDYTMAAGTSGVSYIYTSGTASNPNGTIQLQIPSGYRFPFFGDKYASGIKPVLDKFYAEVKASGYSPTYVIVDYEPDTDLQDIWGDSRYPFINPASGFAETSAPSGHDRLSVLIRDPRYPEFSGMIGFNIADYHANPTVGAVNEFNQFYGPKYAIFSDTAHNLLEKHHHNSIYLALSGQFPNARFTNFESHHSVPGTRIARRKHRYGINLAIGTDGGHNCSWDNVLHAATSAGGAEQKYNPVWVDWSPGVLVGAGLYTKYVGVSSGNGVNSDVHWSNFLLYVETTKAHKAATKKPHFTVWTKHITQNHFSGLPSFFIEGQIHNLLTGSQLYLSPDSAHNSSGNMRVYDDIMHEFSTIAQGTITYIPELDASHDETNYEYFRKPFYTTTADVDGRLLTRVTPKFGLYSNVVVAASSLNNVNGLVVYDTASNRRKFFPRGQTITPSFQISSSGYWISQPNRTDTDAQDYSLARQQLLYELFPNDAPNPYEPPPISDSSSHISQTYMNKNITILYGGDSERNNLGSSILGDGQGSYGSQIPGEFAMISGHPFGSTQQIKGTNLTTAGINDGNLGNVTTIRTTLVNSVGVDYETGRPLVNSGSTDVISNGSFVLNRENTGSVVILENGQVVIKSLSERTG